MVTTVDVDKVGEESEAAARALLGSVTGAPMGDVSDNAPLRETPTDAPQQVPTAPQGRTSPVANSSAMSSTPTTRISGHTNTTTSGFGRALKHLLTPEKIRQSLAWQRGSPTTSDGRRDFKTQVVGQHDLVAFASMSSECPTIEVVHSIATFFQPGAPTHINSREFGLVGDWEGDIRPTSVKLPKLSPWTWSQPKVVADGELMREHYAAASAEEQDKLWTPSSTVSGGATTVSTPRMLLIPGNCLQFLTDKPRTPFEFYDFVCKLATNDSTVAEVEWEFVKEWAICAAQTKSDNTETSCLALDMESGATAFEGLQKFLRNRTHMTMLGHEAPSPSQQGAQPAAATSSAALDASFDRFANKLAHVTSKVNAGGTTSSSTKGVTFTNGDWATIKGLCGTKDVSQIPTWWGYIQTTKSKNDWRTYLTKKMNKFASENNLPIDRSAYLTDDVLESIAKLNFNPGVGIAVFETASSGLSPLVCRPWTAAAVEKMKQKEKAKAASATNRSFAESMELSKGDPVTPPDTYNELCKMANTWCALLFSVFGEHGSLCNKTLGLCDTLATESVALKEGSFTASLCRQITWAKIDDARQVFHQRMHEDELLLRVPNFPISHLDDIATNVRNVEEFNRATFPTKWLVSTPLPLRGGRLPAPAAEYVPVPAHLMGLPPPSFPPITPGSGRHPKIAALMDPYIEKFGPDVNMFDLLTTAGKTFKDIPKAPGLRKLCWKHAVSFCPYQQRCSHGVDAHPTQWNDQWANEVCTVLEPVITMLLTAEGSPSKKQKTGQSDGDDG
jgi:hypothetical protein